ncbi:MAG: hypothetical protein ACYTG5_06870 [Planctomycetota bacterium]|jgi:lysophospholipase L1-like esterase
MNLRPLLRRLLYFGIASCLLLVICELGLQLAAAVFPKVDYLLSPPWTRVKADDATLGYRPSPYFPGHDEWGFRNATVPEFCELLTIGDSMTYGYSAQEGESWPARMQKHLDVSLYNMSFGGYGPIEYLALLREGLALKPKVVLIAVFMGNDISGAYSTVYLKGRGQEFRNLDATVQAMMAEADRYGLLPDLADRFLYPELEFPRPDEPFNLRGWISDHLALWGLLRELRYSMDSSGYKSPFREDAQARDEFEIASKRPERYVYFGTEQDRTTFLPPRAQLLQQDMSDPRIADGYRILEAVLAAMQDEVSTTGSKLGVILIPTKHRVYRDLIEKQGGEGSETLLQAVASEEHWTRLLEGFLQRRSIPSVNTLPKLQEVLTEQHKPYPDSEDGHPNGVGYAAMTDAAEPMVRELLNRGK